MCCIMQISFFFFIAQHIDASSVVWALIDNGKLANQIAILAVLEVKSQTEHIMCAMQYRLIRYSILSDNTIKMSKF